MVLCRGGGDGGLWCRTPHVDNSGDPTLKYEGTSAGPILFESSIFCLQHLLLPMVVWYECQPIHWWRTARSHVRWSHTNLSACTLLISEAGKVCTYHVISSM